MRTLYIHNNEGQEVYKKMINNATLQNKIKLDSELFAGTYHVTVLGQNKYAQSKIIVIK